MKLISMTDFVLELWEDDEFVEDISSQVKNEKYRI